MKKPRDENTAELTKLVERAKTGDREAFGALISATEKRLFRFCLALCGDRALAEDLAQESYLKVHRSLGGLEKPEAFLDWLFRMAKNLYLDHYRSKASQGTPLEDEDPASLGVESRDLSQMVQVHKVLSQFEAEDRLLLLLVDLEGATYLEAAEALGISEDAVRTRLFRLRKAFIEKFSKS